MSPIHPDPSGLPKFGLDPEEYKLLRRVGDHPARHELLARFRAGKGVPKVIYHHGWDGYIEIDGVRYVEPGTRSWFCGAPAKSQRLFTPLMCPDFQLATWMLRNDLATYRIS